jgi:amidohydrolase
MANLESSKDKVQDEVDRIAPALIECSDWMADNPEIGLREFEASARLSRMLEEAGAGVKRGIAGLPTAFRAVLPGGHSNGPTVAIVAEYDALPEVGHGCGHNIIGNSAVGAGVALAQLARAEPLPGTVIVIGSPAEESAVAGAGGKIPILEQGYFDPADVAIMIHPLFEDRVSGSSMTAYGVTFEFHGKAAHAAFDPDHGINALDAVIQTFVSIGMLRQQIRSESRIHGVVTHGGGAPNVIPAYAACRFRIRSFDPVYAVELKQRVIACADGAAAATGARLEWHEDTKPYLSMIGSDTIGKLLRANMQALGRRVAEEADASAASTDFGNVSQAVPACTAFFAICGQDTGWHSKEVAAATKTPTGHQSLIAAAKTLAMTALDLLYNPDLIAQAKREHEESMKPIREGLAELRVDS